MKIADENSTEGGKYCGVQSGKDVFLFGKKAVLTFHTDGSVSANGFRIVFTFVQLGKCNETDQQIQNVDQIKQSGIKIKTRMRESSLTILRSLSSKIILAEEQPVFWGVVLAEGESPLPLHNFERIKAI